MTTSLAEFLAKDRKEVTVTRHGFDRYPDHQQSAEIESRALASGISASAINDVFEAYIRNEFDLNSMELWLEENKLRRPHLWPDVGTYALAAAAFSENGVLNLKSPRGSFAAMSLRRRTAAVTAASAALSSDSTCSVMACAANVGEGFAVAVSAGVLIFGQSTIQGPVLFVTHEDDYADCKDTAEAYARYLGVDFESLPLRIWSLQEHDITLAIVDDKGGWERGPFYTALESKLRETPGLFVVLDCRSDIVQMNEILREPPNTFYKTVLTPLCKKYGCTILVLCHPSKASMADGSFYSGGTGNKSALRNKLVMKLEDPTGPDTGPRVLEVLKRNKGARGSVRLTFDPSWNIFVPDDDAKVAEVERDLYNRVLDAVLELLRKGIGVVATHGAGRNHKDVAEYINRQRKPEEPIVTGKQVRSMLMKAVDVGALGYNSGKSHGKAGYYIIAAAEPWAD
ncbi:MAG: AAA family ATPase [Steroidobacteraceae bacterium]